MVHILDQFLHNLKGLVVELFASSLVIFSFSLLATFFVIEGDWKKLWRRVFIFKPILATPKKAAQKKCYHI